MVLQLGIPVGRIEFLDDLSMDAANKYFNLDYPVCPTLFVEFIGSPQSIKEQAETVGKFSAKKEKSLLLLLLLLLLLQFFVIVAIVIVIIAAAVVVVVVVIR